MGCGLVLESSFAELCGRDTDVRFDEFAEEGEVWEIERVGDFFDGSVGVFELLFDGFDGDFVNPFECCFVSDGFDGGGEVFGGYVELCGDV